MSEIKAVIFDVDGTLLDTREFIQHAFEHTLERHRFAVPEKAVLLEILRSGAPLHSCYEIFAPGGDILSLRETHGKFQKDHLELAMAYDGLIELLQLLKSRGIRLAACSSRGGTVRTSLRRAQALPYFEIVLDANDVVHHKPDPEGILKILESMNIEPVHAAMIGDTRADIEAGKNAGVLMTIGVTHGFGLRETLEDAGADHVVDSLQDVPTLLM